ncbi:MAG: metal-dependent hydrolase [Dehalococcoidia bacterium]
MASPLGHTLVGVALARRLGVRSPFGMGASVVAASLPDVDVIAGIALHRDPWRLHRGHTHTLGFALSSGMLAGFSGVVSAGNAEGDRDLVADAFAGALIVASHLLLDKLPVPYLSTKKSLQRNVKVRNSILNLALDGVVYGALAWKIWPREAPART